MSSQFRLGPARNFTDYRPNCEREEEFKAKLGITTDIEYKKFLMSAVEPLSSEGTICLKCGKVEKQ